MTCDLSLPAFEGENALHGVDFRTETSELGTGTFYVLGKQGSDSGFFRYTDTYMPARKAYLLVDGGTTLARGLRMVFDDEATSISTTDFTDYTDGADVWFTLDGRKLSGKPTLRGIYIRNGKKTVIK